MSNLSALADKLQTKHLHKEANSPNAFYELIRNYENGADILRDFAEAMKMSVGVFAQVSDLGDPENKRIHAALMKQANLVFSILPQMEALDKELYPE